MQQHTLYQVNSRTELTFVGKYIGHINYSFSDARIDTIYELENGSYMVARSLAPSPNTIQRKVDIIPSLQSLYKTGAIPMDTTYDAVITDPYCRIARANPYKNDLDGVVSILRLEDGTELAVKIIEDEHCLTYEVGTAAYDDDGVLKFNGNGFSTIYQSMLIGYLIRNFGSSHRMLQFLRRSIGLVVSTKLLDDSSTDFIVVCTDVFAPYLYSDYLTENRPITYHNLLVGSTKYGYTLMSSKYVGKYTYTLSDYSGGDECEAYIHPSKRVAAIVFRDKTNQEILHGVFYSTERGIKTGGNLKVKDELYRIWHSIDSELRIGGGSHIHKIMADAYGEPWQVMTSEYTGNDFIYGRYNNSRELVLIPMVGMIPVHTHGYIVVDGGDRYIWVEPHTKDDLPSFYEHTIHGESSSFSAKILPYINAEILSALCTNKATIE